MAAGGLLRTPAGLAVFGAPEPGGVVGVLAALAALRLLRQRASRARARDRD